MKRFKTIFGVIVITSSIFFTSPVVAQTGTNSTTTSHTTEDDRDDHGKWGLLGLLGLAGLLGLRKKDDARYSTTDTSVRNKI